MSPITFIPPELVELIVAEIDDVPSLKACSLVASIFCEPSQRILLRSFRLEHTRTSSLAGISALLEQSPHVATYITCLDIIVNFWDTSAAGVVIERMQQIFSKLRLHFFDPEHHTPALALALFNFLARQPLRELHVYLIRLISAALVLRLLTTAPTISFRIHTEVDEHAEDLLSSAPLNPPKMEDLFLGQYTKGVYQLLVQPQSKPYTQALRRLSFLSQIDPDSRLIFNTAQTLEHINFNLKGLRSPVTILVPALPSLRSVEFSLSFRSHPTPWFLQAALALLDASPLLVDVVISFFPLSAYEEDRPPHILDTKLMTALDVASAAHAAGPDIRWRFPLDAEQSRDSIVDSAAAGLRRGMPKMHKKRRLWSRCSICRRGSTTPGINMTYRRECVPDQRDFDGDPAPGIMYITGTEWHIVQLPSNL